MTQPDVRRSLWLAAFGIAMGLLESAVVVYLRELYYPNGFRFPVVALAPSLERIEICREACTLVMLFAVAAIAAHDRMDGFFVFGFLFGTWDLAYYAGLKIFLSWPESLWTWDLLFLIPVAWVAPVLAPILISLLLVAGYGAHTRARSRNRAVRLRGTEWAVATTAGIVVIVALCWEYRAAFTATAPSGFPWMLFSVGLLLGVAPFVRAIARALRN